MHAWNPGNYSTRARNPQSRLLQEVVVGESIGGERREVEDSIAEWVIERREVGVCRGARLGQTKFMDVLDPRSLVMDEIKYQIIHVQQLETSR